MDERLKKNEKNNFCQYPNKTDIETLTDFYFSNTYPQDNIKAQKMQKNVHSDIKPFSRYIEVSIESMKRNSAKGADVKILENTEELYLVPKFTLVKPALPKNQFSIEKPCDIFILESYEDFDSETFEVNGRKGEIFTFKDKVYSYKGSVFVRLPQETAKTLLGKKFDLYDDYANKDNSIKCEIKPVSYEDFYSYRIEGIKVQSVEEKENTLVFSTKDDISALAKIKLFGETFPVSKSNLPEKMNFTANGKPLEKLTDSIFVIPQSQDNAKILANGKPIKHSVAKLEEMSNDELQFILNTKDVCIQNGRLVYKGDAEQDISFGKLHFDIKMEKLHFRKQLKDKSGNYIGTVIEVVESTNSIKDLESNVDVFFKDTTEKLTDKLPYNKDKCRTFKIGRTDENQSLLEITEDKNGRLEKLNKKTLPEHLYAVPNDWQLNMQKNAIAKLQNMPCKDFERLLELFERKSEKNTNEGYQKFGAAWKSFSLAEISEWFLLTDEKYEGCFEQREFVRKTMATPDFSFLDGPPGSGKTTSLLELIAQLVMKGKKVLLTASTNAAVDNILERLETLPEEIQSKIFAVRIGNENAMSDTIQKYSLSGVPNEFHEEIVMRANVVCGTIFGVLKHPAFKLNGRNQPVRPLYDYLIIDEASKTTFQDFLVPALYSKHWILSGDLKQLTPYVEQETIQSSLEEIPEFDKNFQHIQTFLRLAKENRFASKDAKFYTVVNAEQIKAAEKLVGDAQNLVGIVTKEKCANHFAASIQEIKNSEKKAVILYGAHFLIIEDSIFKEMQNILPQDFVPLFGIKNDKSYTNLFLTASAESFFKGKSLELGTGSDKGTRKNLQEVWDYWKNAVKEHSWAKEITWRLCRIQELFLDAEKGKTVKHYKEEIEQRLPSFEVIIKSEKKDIKEILKQYCDSISGIALPSILQLLQNGLSEDVVKNLKETTLNKGFDKDDFENRHTMLTFQHRMHPSISEFSASNIYEGKALKDGSELQENREWKCFVFGENHSVWLDTKSNENRTNENLEEISLIEKQLRDFMKWTKENPKKDEKNWTVACLTYYKKQERRLKERIKNLFGEQKEKSWYKSDEKHIEVFIYTVDKFQGREADVVFLSLVKSGSVSLGFMDSPNRLNVALTRARYQRVIVGTRKYFRNTKKSELLNKLAESENLYNEVKK